MGTTGESGKSLLSVSEAARVLGVSPGTVRRWSNSGTLACVRTPSGHRRFRRADLERLYAA